MRPPSVHEITPVPGEDPGPRWSVRYPDHSALKISSSEISASAFSTNHSAAPGCQGRTPAFLVHGELDDVHVGLHLKLADRRDGHARRKGDDIEKAVLKLTAQIGPAAVAPLVIHAQLGHDAREVGVRGRPGRTKAATVKLSGHPVRSAWPSANACPAPKATATARAVERTYVIKASPVIFLGCRHPPKANVAHKSMAM